MKAAMVTDFKTSEVVLVAREKYAESYFGVVDNKGRRVGALVMAGKSRFDAQPESAISGWNIAPGEYFWIQVQATRNGISFGPAQPRRFFATSAERTAAVNQYMRAALARAEKAFGGVR